MTTPLMSPDYYKHYRKNTSIKSHHMKDKLKSYNVKLQLKIQETESLN